MIIKMWREEWKVQAFTLNYHTPEHFTRCHWQKAEKVTAIWIIYRAFVALYFLFSFIYTVSPFGRDGSEENSSKYLIFLTHWTYILETFQFILALAIVIHRAVIEAKKPAQQPMPKMPWYYQIYWVCYTIVVTAAIVVTVVFWVVIYEEGKFPHTGTIIIEHLFNSVFVLLDFWLVGHPVKFLHFYLPIFYGFIYATFSLVYQLSGGKGVKGEIPIYPILDWRHPGPAILNCVLIMIFLIFVHLLYSLHSICKFAVYPKPDRSENSPNNSP